MQHSADIATSSCNDPPNFSEKFVQQSEHLSTNCSPEMMRTIIMIIQGDSRRFQRRIMRAKVGWRLEKFIDP
jgi:hypothetical protein